MLQRKTRAINKEVAEELGYSISTVETVLLSQWSCVRQFMTESDTNAIYLRFLGTFYTKPKRMYVVNQHRKEKQKNVKCTE